MSLDFVWKHMDGFVEGRNVVKEDTSNFPSNGMWALWCGLSLPTRVGHFVSARLPNVISMKCYICFPFSKRCHFNFFNCDPHVGRVTLHFLETSDINLVQRRRQSPVLLSFLSRRCIRYDRKKAPRIDTNILDSTKLGPDYCSRNLTTV